MASNYHDVIEQLESAGLQVDDIITGRMQRVPVEGDGEKRGWYILHELALDGGDLVLVGSYGVWRGNDNGAQKIELKKQSLTPEQKAAIKARLAEDRRRMEAQAKADAARAAARAESAWRKCATTGESDYLTRKGVGAHGVRFSPGGAVVVPMMDAGHRVHGLQFILSRERHGARIKRTGRDKEFWPKGLSKRGHFHLIGLPTWLLVVAEGYATAATIHEATGLPVAVAFDAGNLLPVAQALHKRYPRARILIAGDDDSFSTCLACKAPVNTGNGDECPSCDEPHRRENAGRKSASAAALAVGGQWFVPHFADPDALWEKFCKQGHKTTDFNDLHALEGLTTVRDQFDRALSAFGWVAPTPRTAAAQPGGEGSDVLRPVEHLDELLERFALIYGEKEAVFDQQERMIVSLGDMRNICISRELHRRWMEHPGKRIVRMANVGFDPTEKDEKIICNTYTGWPTKPKEGSCELLLELLAYLTSADDDPVGVYRWLLKWIAYPIQNPGSKMASAIVMHGAQGTGKSKFFKSVSSIYGHYGLTINQAAVENHRNTWLASRLFILAEEVVARQELYHVKNALKDLVTGDTVYVDPKFVNPYAERNHVNLVFLSNETMPIVLEDDDRRHLVVYTPDEPLPPQFYVDLQQEIDSGGVAALHSHLLGLDLTGFGPHTKPPMTRAKSELQNLALDSTTRFYRDLVEGEIEGVKPGTCALSTDVFELYRTYCARINVKPAPMPRLINALEKKHRVRVERKRYLDGQSKKGPHGVCFLPCINVGESGNKVVTPTECPAGHSEPAWIGSCITAFRNAVKDYKGGAHA